MIISSPLALCDQPCYGYHDFVSGLRNTPWNKQARICDVPKFWLSRRQPNLSAVRLLMLSPKLSTRFGLRMRHSQDDWPQEILASVETHNYDVANGVSSLFVEGVAATRCHVHKHCNSSSRALRLSICTQVKQSFFSSRIIISRFSFKVDFPMLADDMITSTTRALAGLDIRPTLPGANEPPRPVGIHGLSLECFQLIIQHAIEYDDQSESNLRDAVNLRQVSSKSNVVLTTNTMRTINGADDVYMMKNCLRLKSCAQFTLPSCFKK